MDRSAQARIAQQTALLRLRHGGHAGALMLFTSRNCCAVGVSVLSQQKGRGVGEGLNQDLLHKVRLRGSRGETFSLTRRDGGGLVISGLEMRDPVLYSGSSA
uniref:Uncharacterized protein n=1 Tax=Sphaerodactylus townsendi TaxID=933632 RepID=A0ACB8EYH9_9SAUR